MPGAAGGKGAHRRQWPAPRCRAAHLGTAVPRPAFRTRASHPQGGSMTLAWIAFDICPACGIPAKGALRLFQMGGSHVETWVLKCRECGLVFKETHPNAGAYRQVYGESYVHFAESPPPATADINSAR